MVRYMTEDEIMHSVMQEARKLSPNVPPVVTWGMFFLRDRLTNVRDRLQERGDTVLVRELQESIRLALEVSGQMEAGFDSLVEAQGQTRN